MLSLHIYIYIYYLCAQRTTTYRPTRGEPLINNIFINHNKKSKNKTKSYTISYVPLAVIAIWGERVLWPAANASNNSRRLCK